VPRSRAYIRKSQPEEQPLLFAADQVAHTDAKDFFPTPVRDGVKAIDGFGWDLAGKVVLDPSCGHGNLLEAARLRGARRTIGLELSKELASMSARKGHLVAQVDSLSVEWPRADFLLGNPPYSQALQFAIRTAEWTEDERHPARSAALLLELDFLSSQGRREFNKVCPGRLHVLSERISFMGGDGSTAKRNYVWIGWGNGFEPSTFEVW
jgi:hypothetical protein